MKNETKVHLKTLRHWCQMDSITLSQEIQTSKKKAFLAEMIASINNDLCGIQNIKIFYLAVQWSLLIM